MKEQAPNLNSLSGDATQKGTGNVSCLRGENINISKEQFNMIFKH